MMRSVGIIGGGIAGLTAGIALARKGVRVHLFEANDKIGGCCATTAVNGFTFNDGAIYLAVPGLLDHVFQSLGLDRPSLLPLRKITVVQEAELPDGSTVTFGEGRQISIEGRPVDLDRVHRDMDAMMRRWLPVLRLFSDDLLTRPFSLPRMLARGWRHLPRLRGTVAAELNRLFGDEALRAAMSGALLFTGVPPQRMPVTALLGLVSMFEDGFYVPEGGMGRITAVLSDALRAAGGEIHTGAPVDRIVVDGGRVRGLEIRGHGFQETGTVLSSVSGMATFGALLRPADVPPRMLRKVRSAPLSHRACIVQLGLRNTIPARAHTVCRLPLMSDQLKLFDAPGSEWLVYSVPTVTMPELAPPGGSIVEAFTIIDQKVPLEDWTEEKKAAVLASTIEKLSESYRMDVAASRVIGPKDHQDWLHLHNGAVYGLSPAASPMALYRHRTPIRGLYQAGQTTYPGFGLGASAISGLLSADALLEHAEV